MISYLIAFFIGGFMGATITCCLVVAKDNKEENKSCQKI